jgi:hypothetical protein
LAASAHTLEKDRSARGRLGLERFIGIFDGLA